METVARLQAVVAELDEAKREAAEARASAAAANDRADRLQTEDVAVLVRVALTAVNYCVIASRACVSFFEVASVVVSCGGSPMPVKGSRPQLATLYTCGLMLCQAAHAATKEKLAEAERLYADVVVKMRALIDSENAACEERDTAEASLRTMKEDNVRLQRTVTVRVPSMSRSE